MTRSPSPAPPSDRPSSWMALGCCLLIACTLFDASLMFVAYFSRDVVFTTRGALDDLAEEPESTEGFLCTRSQLRTCGRSERQPSLGLAQFGDIYAPSARDFLSYYLGQNPASRAGCEHSWRNGLGAPLLC